MNSKNHKKVILVNYITFIINLKHQTRNNLKIKLNVMQFLLIACDGTDPEAENRRTGARPLHLEKIGKLKRRGEFIFGGAILNNEEKMTGSVILYDFPDRKTMDERLKGEPYINEGVWKEIKIMPFRLAQIE